MDFSSNSYEHLKQLYLNGKSLSLIERENKFCRKKLASLLKKDGVEIIQDNKQYVYEESLFDVVDSEEKAYWLGFLYADGYISKSSHGYKMELCLAEIDRCHVENFKNLICKTKPLQRKVVRLNNREFISYRISISNKNIISSLIEKGCVNNKSTLITMPFQHVPTSLMKHFIRGYVDGDGSIGLYSGKATFNLCCGSESFLIELQKYFEKNIVGYTSVKIQKDKRSNLFKLCKGGNASVINVLKFIYEDANVFLQRKYEKYLEILEVKLPSSRETD